jgi:hypothetical protein
LVNERDEGISNAVIDVITYGAKGGAPIRRERLRTSHDGSFKLILHRAEPSRRLRFAYRSHVGDAQPTSVFDLRLKVRAALSLRVGPRSLRNGDVLTFAGRLLGHPIPRPGKLVEVQVRYPTHWGTFATVRTTRSGAFRYRRRLLHTFQPTVYSFRVRSREESGYPYETGVSRVVRVRVRVR